MKYFKANFHFQWIIFLSYPNQCQLPKKIICIHFSNRIINLCCFTITYISPSFKLMISLFPSTSQKHLINSSYPNSLEKFLGEVFLLSSFSIIFYIQHFYMFIHTINAPLILIIREKKSNAIFL